MCHGIGDLGFGASFDCLRKTDNRQWINTFAGPAARLATNATLRRMVLPDWLCDYIKKIETRGPQNGPFQAYVAETVGARMEWTVQRPDLIEGLLAKEKEQVSAEPWYATLSGGLVLTMTKAVPRRTVMLTAGLLLGAGFETTSSLVAATLYLLLRNPRCLEKATREVRSSFESQSDISFATLDKLTYMIACLNEALRWYPPIAGGMPREVMKGGTTVAGRFVPEGVCHGLEYQALAVPTRR